MQLNLLKCVSLNLNGLNNPIKRGKVLNKLKKEKADIIYLQETHILIQNMKNLKTFDSEILFIARLKEVVKEE